MISGELPSPEISQIASSSGGRSFAQTKQYFGMDYQYRPPLPVALRTKNKARRQRALLGFITLLALADVLAIFLGATVAYGIRFGAFSGEMAMLTIIFFVFLYAFSAIYIGSFAKKNITTISRSVTSSVKSFIASFVIFLLAIFLLKVGVEFSRIYIFIFFFTGLISVGLCRFLVTSWIGPKISAAQPLKLTLIADGVSVEALPPIYDVLTTAELGLLPEAGDRAQIERLVGLVQQYEAVRLYCRADERRQWSALLRCLNVRSEIRVPELDGLRPLALLRYNDRCAMLVSENPLEWHQRLTKRLFDLCVVVAAMPIALPLMALVAVAIKVETPGPVLFRQDRIGLGNRRFQVLKFRSMYHGASDQNADALTTRNDSRVTKVGAILRKTSLDECPQLLNVLFGDMSLVGPRPHAYGAKAGDLLYWEVDEDYWQRHVVKPGITGLAQIRGFRGNTFEESDLQNRLDADLEYVSNWSLLRDVGIILATLRVVVHDRAF